MNDFRNKKKQVIQAQLDAFMKKDKDYWQQVINDLQLEIFQIEQDIALYPQLPPDYDPNNPPTN